jgi:K(+)-stimulated pyrophosphate-energized sodium pump
VALNPIIKFSTLFGLLAVEIAVHSRQTGSGNFITVAGVALFAVALVFVWRSFYAMRIPREDPGARKLPETDSASH